MTSIQTERKQLVVFGFIMAAAALFFAWFLDMRNLAWIALPFVITSIAAPRAMEPLYRVWMRLAEVLGWINTRILLILIYFLVVTPIGLLMRLFARSPLATEERDGSFWSEAPKHSWGDKHFEKQF